MIGSRRDLLQSGAAALAAMAIPGSGANAHMRKDASIVKNAPDFSQGGTPVRLLADEAPDPELGDSACWLYELEGTVQFVDKDELQARIWYDNRWCKIDTISEFGAEKVIWFDKRPEAQASGRYEREQDLGRAWEKQVVCAFFQA